MFVFTALLLLNCSKKNEADKQLSYIISKKQYQGFKKSAGGRTLPPPQFFYAANHILIDKKGDFYYYQKSNPFLCGFGHNDSIPPILGLDPINIIKVPKENTGEFVFENMKDQEPRRRVLIIGSQKDTLQGKYPSKLLYFLQKNRIVTMIRHTTQEEDTLLTYKKTGNYYDIGSIKWDKKRIQLPERE